MPRKATKNGPRIRTFAGCSTCRARKVRCDETRPHCLACQRGGFLCEGFEARLRWIFYNGKADSFTWASGDLRVSESHHGRRLLLTEDARMAMSESISGIVSAIGLDYVIEEIDYQCIGEEGSPSAFTGPFGVFRLSNDERGGRGSRSLSKIESDLLKSDSLSSTELDLALTSSVHDLSSEPRHEWNDAIWNESHFDISTEDAEIIQLTQQYLPPQPESTSIPSPFIINQKPEALSLAHFLLGHYKGQSGKLFSPLRVRKSPWEVLHLSCAVKTLSELAIWGDASHARKALFFALLAVSSFHLDRTQPSLFHVSNYWWVVGNSYRQVAKREIQLYFSQEMQGPKRSKYKEVLMALLTMITISVVSGEHKDTRCFLLDAEKLICLRGIPKAHKSRKLRLLHHIYLFLRVVEESTYIYGNDHFISNIAAKQKLNGALQFPSLKTHSSRMGKDLDEICGGDFEEGLIGKDSDNVSLFKTIYGIPESLLSLLSQATSLANQVDAHKVAFGKNSTTDDICREMKRLEEDIINWQWAPNLPDSDLSEDNYSSRGNESILYHLVHAIHDALVVYFYRRVYDLNPAVLQGYVDSATKHLLQCEQKKLHYNVINCGIVWPGFITATEALGPTRQSKLLGWLRASAQSSGLRNFDTAADVVEKVWKERDQGNSKVTWMDLVRERKVSLILT